MSSKGNHSVSRDYRGRGNSARLRNSAQAGNLSREAADVNLQPIDAEGLAAAHDEPAEESAPSAQSIVEPELSAGEAVQPAESVPSLGVSGGAEFATSTDPQTAIATCDPPPSSVEADAGGVSYSRDERRYEHRKGPRAFFANFSKKQKIVLAIVAIVAILLSVVGGAFAVWYQNTQANISLSDPTVKSALTQTANATDPYWTLILGSDSRAESKDRARSDVLMLARIDPANAKVTLVSIPRDTKVDIAGYGSQKINAAYSLGGAKLAISTVEDYAGIKISHYMELYFSGFRDLVDQLGGITVDVPEYCSYNGVTIKPGKQTLNGKQALTLARCRKTYALGDFTRTGCQRLLVQAIVTKILSEGASQIPTTLSSLSKCFSTDMAMTDLVSLATQMKGMKSSSFYSAMAPSTTGTVDGVSYVFTYINQWKLLMQKASAGENPKLTKKEEDICGFESTKTDELDMSEGLPSSVEKKLQKYWNQQAAKKSDSTSSSDSSAATTSDASTTSSSLSAS